MRRAIDYARLMSDEALDETFVLRMTKADRELLDSLASRLPLKATQIARIALRLGLTEIDKDPARIFAAGSKPKAKR
jgi:hypothetical protein